MMVSMCFNKWNELGNDDWAQSSERGIEECIQQFSWSKRNIKAGSESPKRSFWHRLMLCFLEDSRGDEPKVRVVYGLEISFFCGRRCRSQVCPRWRRSRGKRLAYQLTRDVHDLYRVQWRSLWSKNWQVNTRQLISVNTNRQCSSDISRIAEKLLQLLRMHARVLVILSIQESLGMSLTWHCLDMCAMAANLGSQRCWFRISFAQLRDRDRQTDRKTEAH